MRRFALLLLLAAATSRAAEPRPWSLEPLVGRRDGDPGDWSGPVVGVRASRLVATHLALRLGLVGFDGSRTMPRIALGEARFQRDVDLEAGVEWRIPVGSRAGLGVGAGTVVSHGRASDAEEWERTTSTHVGWRASVAGLVPLGRRVVLRPELARVAHDVTTVRRGRDPVPPFDGFYERVTERAEAWELSVAVAFRLDHPKRHAIE